MSGNKQPLSLRKVAVRHAARGTVGLLSAALVSSHAFADTADAKKNPKNDDIEEVLVEGRQAGSNPYADPMAPYKIDRSASSKLTQSILDAAKSITVLPKELIDDTGTNTFRDLMRIQPGVTLGTGEGGNAFGDRVFIRGFDARNDVYIDGVRDPGVTSRETFAVEQIEIFKGPSSAFGGRGTTGGAISMISKAPQAKDFGDVEVTVGTDDTKRVTADVNRQLSDKLAVRVNGMYHDSETAGRDEVFNERWGVAAAAAYQMNESVELGLDYYHLETDGLPDWGVPYDVANNEPFKVDRNNFYGLVNRDFHKNNIDIVTGQIRAELSDGKVLRSVLRYGHTWNGYVVSAPERPVTTDPDPANWTVSASPKNRNQTNKYLVNQTDLTWKSDFGGVEHTFVGGFEFSKEKIHNNPYGFLDSEDPSTGGSPTPGSTSVSQNLWNPDPHLPWDLFAVPGTSYTESEISTKAFFLIDTIELNDQWQVFGGLRFDDFSIDYTSIGGRGGDMQLHSSDNFFNWHAGVTYKPAENGNVYVAIGSSSNPPGEQVDGGGAAYGGISGSSQSIDAERNMNYEIGTKWAVFDEHFLVSAALFRIEKTAGRSVTGSGSSEVTTLNGEQRVDGFEIGLSGNVTEKLSLFGGVTLLDTEILASDNEVEIGSKLPNVAETSATLLAKYQATERFSFGGTAVYASKIYGGTTFAGTTYLPSHWRFDAFAHFELKEGVEISLNVQNLTDKVYYDSLYRSSAPFTYIAPGRSATVTLDIDF